jgi:aspartyl-tRNA(Asn)/glutamyl-tRNA(Gln) amidotransferase subunit A
MSELTSLTIAEAAELIARRVLSPLELTRALIARIETLDPQLNSFITRTFESALRQAQSAEDAVGRSEYRGGLHGIPLALKDLYETRAVRTTAGAKFYSDHVPDADSVVVQRLSEAGAVSLGKLNMHEWAFGVTNVNPHFGACHNPWRLDRIPGGSSGGAGAALAAGLCLGAIGSDTGGSIRIPASLCGVVGLKPTYGRVSTRGVVPLSWNLDHAGPMARRVRDTAMLLQAIAGYDSADPYSIDVASDDYLAHLGDSVRGWRVALARDEWFGDADREVIGAVGAAAGVFERLGAEVHEVTIPQAREAAQLNLVILTGDAATFHRERLRARPQDFGEDVRARLQRADTFSAIDYASARRAQQLFRHWFESFFDQYDVLLTPTTPITAPLREGADAVEAAKALTRFTAPFNLAGLPALSLPCGFSQEGLPIGLQIVGRPWAEATVLRAGHAYEQATDWHQRLPAL